MTPEDIILDRYNQNKLAPLYIIRGPIKSERVNLDQWVKTLCLKLLAKEKNLNQEQAKTLFTLGHSDLVLLKKEKEAKEYRQKDGAAEEFIKAHNYPPLELKHKLIFVHQAQDISLNLANKWLKTLEEPLAQVSTFFLCDTPVRLLQTIESRAITLRLSPQGEFEAPKAITGPFHAYLGEILKEDASEKLAPYIRTGQMHYLLEYLKGSENIRRDILNHLSNFIIAHPANLRAKSKWLEELKWFQKAKAYNNVASERFVGLLQVIEQCS